MQDKPTIDDLIGREPLTPQCAVKVSDKTWPWYVFLWMRLRFAWEDLRDWWDA